MTLPSHSTHTDRGTHVGESVTADLITQEQFQEEQLDES